MLLFTLASMFLVTGTGASPAQKNANGLIEKLIAGRVYSVFTSRIILPNNDTITKGQSQENNHLQMNQLNNEEIDFQINSNITYLGLNNFVNQDARSIFIQARQKEKEVAALTAQNDSLRNVYANSSEDRRQSLADIILKNESKTIALNEEIPELYQRARHIENQYWQNATEDQVTQFQEKINRTKDSLKLANSLMQQKQHPTPAIPDTLIMTSPEVPLPEPQNTQPTGVVYKIQIAAAKYKLPPSIDKLIKKLSIIRQIENYKDEKGVTIYTTGNLKTWKEAETMQKQVKQEGVKNPLVVAYKDGKKIAVNDARKITGEL